MSLVGLRVRVARVDDLTGVVALERGVGEAPHWAEAEYAAIVKADRNIDGAMRRCMLVAEAEGRLVGFAVGKVIGSGAGSIAELETVVVDSAARRRGVGRALCSEIVAWCGKQGAPAVELEVRAGSGGAIALYAGLGFVVVGRRERYYPEPADDAVLMRLELAKCD